MRKFIFLSIFLTIFSISCGYSTRSTLPANIRTIYVEPFKNNIDYTASSGRRVYFSLLEVNSRNAVIDRFLFDGRLKIAKPDEADYILKGNLVGYERSPLRYTDSDDVEEYRVHVSVSFELLNPYAEEEGEEVLWAEPSFVGEATYFVTGPLASSEETAVDEAIIDLARRIVERTIEDW